MTKLSLIESFTVTADGIASAIDGGASAAPVQSIASDRRPKAGPGL